MRDHSPRVIVTGASSGIGKATAIRFAQEGWDVCLVARRKHLLEEICNSLPAGNHLVCAGSYDEVATTEHVREAIQAEWGNIAALVNCAGVYMAADAVSSPLEEWRKPFDIRVNGAILLSRVSAALMKDGGRIIHVTSIHGDRVENQARAYAMAKAAINATFRVLAASATWTKRPWL